MISFTLRVVIAFIDKLLKPTYFTCINSCAECSHEKIVIIGTTFAIVKESIEKLYLLVD